MTTEDPQSLFAQGYAAAVALLSGCCTDDGFLASKQDHDNYRRIWGRDGAIITLAALLTEEKKLIDCGARTLLTLADHQGPHGEIPSNVDPQTKRVSYGGSAGRVDSNLWFIIAAAEYWQRTEDLDFLRQIHRILEKACFLLGAWEYNNRNLLYVPLTGDWADEYVHNGYVLYDQLLYLQALRSLCAIHAVLHGSEDHYLLQKVSRLKHLIQANYWLGGNRRAATEDVYHEVLHRKGLKAAAHCDEKYWMPFFSPTGYGYRFDALANVLASLLQVAEPFQQQAVDAHIAHITRHNSLKLLPAYHPVITPKDEDWEELQMTFSYTFKNKPYEFQNGGLWPMITGFYVADLAGRDEMEKAGQFLDAIHRANSIAGENGEWLFPEFVNGKTFEAGGTMLQGWSAAAAVIGHHALKGNHLFHFLPR